MSTAPLSKPLSPPRTVSRPALNRGVFKHVSTTPAIISPPKAAHRMEAIKAAIDYPAAVIMLLFFGPVILIGMLIVKLTSRGPALYTQVRVGRANKPFIIYKLRTMYDQCETKSGPKWSLPGDNRITPVGRVFRALHIDELPQLWNVIRGDMSLIGPRPERPEICSDLRKNVPGYDYRHAVKPGITGFAQVHLPPDSCLRSVKNKVAYDRFYLIKSSIRMEFFIIGCTLLKLCGLRRLYQRAPRKPVEFSKAGCK